jgi:hypothetical protein
VTSGRVSSFIVTLADGTQPAETEMIAAAIGLLKGVVSVQPLVGDVDLQSARTSIDAEWRQRIIGLLDDEGV